jgi:transposase
MPGPSSGNTPTPPAPSAVTKSLRQATNRLLKNSSPTSKRSLSGQSRIEDKPVIAAVKCVRHPRTSARSSFSATCQLEVVKRSEQHRFRVLPKRWIVERTFAWLAWSSRLSKDYEICPASAETMTHIAFAHLLLRRST